MADNKKTVKKLKIKTKMRTGFNPQPEPPAVWNPWKWFKPPVSIG